MSIPQAQFILVVNQDAVDAVKELLPGVLFAQVFPHDIGLERLSLIATPKPVSIPESAIEPSESVIDEALADPAEIPEEKSYE